MKTFLLILFLASPAWSSIGVVVSSNATGETQSFIVDSFSADQMVFARIADPFVTQRLFDLDNSADRSAFATLVGPTVLTSLLRASALQYINSEQGVSKAQRAIFLALLDAFNASIQRERNMDADIAAATSLADLKARRAARPIVNDITPQQAKTAVQNKIDSGQAD